MKIKEATQKEQYKYKWQIVNNISNCTILSTNDERILISYNTFIMSFNSVKNEIIYNTGHYNSHTTNKHINKFLNMFGIMNCKESIIKARQGNYGFAKIKLGE